MWLALLALGVALLSYYYFFRRPSGLPPGVWGLPIIGYIPRGKTRYQVVQKLQRKYGDIFMWRSGSQTTVVLSDFDSIKAAFQLPQLQGRKVSFTTGLVTFGLNAGVTLANGKVHSDGRQFLRRHLGDSEPKDVSWRALQEEVRFMIAALLTKVGEPVDLDRILNLTVFNVLWKFIAGRRYDMHDEQTRLFEQNLKCMNLNAHSDVVLGPASLLELLPWIKNIIPHFITTKWMKVDVIQNNFYIFQQFALQVVCEHVENLDVDNPKDFIDQYLVEVKATKDDLHTTFTPDLMNLVVMMGELCTAGGDGMMSTLRWMLLLMALYPEVQAKVQAEIDEVTRSHEDEDEEDIILRSHQDRDRMPYTDAMLMEVQRVCTLTPLGLAHLATEELHLEGYTIPKNTLVSANIGHCHTNPKFWKEPNEFNPQNFLDTEGRLLLHKDGYLPFSFGLRCCVAQNFATMNVFFLSAALLQHFTIRPPKGVLLSTKTDTTKPFLNFVEPFKVVLEKRR